MKELNLVLVNGKAGSGKDTIALYLKTHYNFSHLFFAYAVKKSLSIITGLDEKYFFDHELKEKTLPFPWDKFTPRKMMQFYGTELMRNQLDKDIWIKSVATKISAILDTKNNDDDDDDTVNVVVSDLRFQNEMYVEQFINSDCSIKKLIIRVDRPGKDGNTQGGLEKHESENGITNYPAETIIINNNQTKDDLYAKVDSLMKTYNIYKFNEYNIKEEDLYDESDFYFFIPKCMRKGLFDANFKYLS